MWVAGGGQVAAELGRDALFEPLLEVHHLLREPPRQGVLRGHQIDVLFFLLLCKDADLEVGELAPRREAVCVLELLRYVGAEVPRDRKGRAHLPRVVPPLKSKENTVNEGKKTRGPRIGKLHIPDESSRTC